MNESEDFGFRSWNTMSPELPDYSYGDPVPDNYVNIPRSSGLSFSGLLSGVESSANSLFNTVGKVYSIQSNLEDKKFQRVVQQQTADINKAATLGNLELQRAGIEANIAIEKARARRAVGDAMAKIESGKRPEEQSFGFPPVFVMLAVGFGIWALAKRR